MLSRLAIRPVTLPYSVHGAVCGLHKITILSTWCIVNLQPRKFSRRTLVLRICPDLAAAVFFSSFQNLHLHPLTFILYLHLFTLQFCYLCSCELMILRASSQWSHYKLFTIPLLLSPLTCFAAQNVQWVQKFRFTSAKDIFHQVLMQTK